MKKKPRARPRATQSEMVIRVNRIAGLLIAGRTRSYILQYCSSHYDLAARASDELIARATEKVLEVNSVGVEEARARVLAGYYAQYRKLQKWPSEAANVLKKIADVYGLHEQTVNFKVDRPLEELSDEQLMQKLKALHAEPGA